MLTSSSSLSGNLTLIFLEYSTLVSMDLSSKVTFIKKVKVDIVDDSLAGLFEVIWVIWGVLNNDLVNLLHFFHNLGKSFNQLLFCDYEIWSSVKLLVELIENTLINSSFSYKCSIPAFTLTNILETLSYLSFVLSHLLTDSMTFYSISSIYFLVTTDSPPSYLY